MDRCRDIVKKYFSCFPLIFRIGVLYLNYGLISKNDKQKIDNIKEAIKLFIRVKEQSNDVFLKQMALHAEAISLMELGNADEIIDLFKDKNDLPSHKVILSHAYNVKGKVKEAKMELQESICNHILELFEAIPAYLIISADETQLFEKIYKRGVDLINTFNLKKIIPISIMPFYLTAAQGYLKNKNTEKCIDALEVYTEIVTSDIYPLKIVKEDDFFNLIESSAEKTPFGLSELPRDEKSLRQSMLDAVIEEPAFSVLSSEPRFNKLTAKLLNNVELKKQKEENP
jgi:tetratricopeptide (TPR) repeat protein